MTATQLTSMIVIILAIAVEVRWMLTHRDKYLLSVPNLIWLVHALVFYIALWGCTSINTNKQLFNEWGAALRLQGYITILMMGLYRIKGNTSKWIL